MMMLLQNTRDLVRDVIGPANTHLELLWNLLFHEDGVARAHVGRARWLRNLSRREYHNALHGYFAKECVGVDLDHIEMSVGCEFLSVGICELSPEWAETDKEAREGWEKYYPESQEGYEDEAGDERCSIYDHAPEAEHGWISLCIALEELESEDDYPVLESAGLKVFGLTYPPRGEPPSLDWGPSAHQMRQVVIQTIHDVLGDAAETASKIRMRTVGRFGSASLTTRQHGRIRLEVFLLADGSRKVRRCLGNGVAFETLSSGTVQVQVGHFSPGTRRRCREQSAREFAPPFQEKLTRNSGTSALSPHSAG